jgi:hypothetical protein
MKPTKENPETPTLRDMFAGQVIAGWFGNSATAPSDSSRDDMRARRAYEVADAMLRARG